LISKYELSFERQLQDKAESTRNQVPDIYEVYFATVSLFAIR